MSNKMNTYEWEQAVTDKYGTAIMNQIAASFYDKFDIQRVTDRETQIKGVDYYFWKKTDGMARAIQQRVDLKFDKYRNYNFAFETSQPYQGVGIKSWVYHDGDIWVAYFKIDKRKVYLMKTSDLQEFMNTELYKRRVELPTIAAVKNNHGLFKNFRLPDGKKASDFTFDIKVIDIDLTTVDNIDPFETDDLLETKKSSKPESSLYDIVW